MTTPLYRNTRVLAVVAQIAFAGLIAGFGWLLWSTMQQNLLKQGIPISFTFLQQPAGFGIAEGPAFDPAQSYLRAFGVGIVNTLRAAIIGVILATLLGIAIGIARLSGNWLLSRLATLYVEAFRNVPLLLWLVFTYAAIRETLPRLREGLSLFGGLVLMSNRGVALVWPVPSASFAAFWPWLLGGIVLAILGVLWRKLLPTAATAAWPLRRVAGILLVVWIGGFVWAWWSTALPPGATVDAEAEVAFVDQNGNGTHEEQEPLLAGVGVRAYQPDGMALTVADGSFRLPSSESTPQRFTLHIPFPLTWSLPRIGGFNYHGGMVLSPEFAALLCGLVVYTAAFIAEIVRAGIQSVPRGQSEAAQALGLSSWQAFRLVIFPQALRVIIPPLINQYLNLTKNSSLAIAVGYPDLFSVGLTINNQTGQAIPFVLMIMTAYLTMSLLTSWLLNWVNRRMALKTT